MYVFHALFGLLLVAALSRAPVWLAGMPISSVFGAYLLVASPLTLSLGILRELWAARVLQAYPIRVVDAGIVFPARGAWRSPRLWEWQQVAAMGTDFGSHRVAWGFATIWLATKGGRVLARPYFLGDSGEEQKLIEAIAALNIRVRVLNRAEYAGQLGARTPSKTWILIARIFSMSVVPVILGVLALLGLARIGDALFFGVALSVVFLLSAPAWLWASERAAFLRTVGSRRKI